MGVAMLRGPLTEQADDGRWKQLASENGQRLDVIHKYSKLRRHPELFEEFQDSWLDPALQQALSELRNTSLSENHRHGLAEALVTQEAPGVYSFQAFSETLCNKLSEELENFWLSELPAHRPNSMNNYGIILNDIGMECMLTSLQERVLQPLASVFFPTEGLEIDGHHSFVVRYMQGEDTHLDTHTDNSDITFNVCLGKHFTGAGLVLCGLKGAPDHRLHRRTYQHRVGRAILHLGRHRHGADNIIDGERLNLIVWNHAYNWRKSRGDDKDPISREKAPPDPECLSYTHDKDFGRFKRYPPGKDHFRGKGWCPLPGTEYVGYRREEL